MKSSTQIALSMRVLTLLVAANPFAWAAGDTSPGGMAASVERSHEWQHAAVESDKDLRFRAAVADAEGGLWVLLTRREKGRPLDQGELHLMRVDASGRRTADEPVPLPAELAPRRVHAATLTLGEDGRPAVLSSTPTGIALIEPAVRSGQTVRLRHVDIDAWPFVATAAGPGQFRVVTNEAVMLWRETDDPQVEFAAGVEQVFFAAGPAPDGFALLRATVTPERVEHAQVGRLSIDHGAVAAFRDVADVAASGLLTARLVASRSSLVLLAPVEKGPPSLWRYALFDSDMNVRHTGLLSLPFALSASTPMAVHPTADGGALLASAHAGQIWLARVDAKGALSERELPPHLSPPADEKRLFVDMAWVRSNQPDHLVLASTVVVMDSARGRTDYGLWLANIAIDDL